jgi:hypothetical protein
MKKKVKQLELKVSTVRALTAQQLQVAGGGPGSLQNCSYSCTTNCTFTQSCHIGCPDTTTIE